MFLFRWIVAWSVAIIYPVEFDVAVVFVVSEEIPTQAPAGLLIYMKYPLADPQPNMRRNHIRLIAARPKVRRNHIRLIAARCHNIAARR